MIDEPLASDPDLPPAKTIVIARESRVSWFDVRQLTATGLRAITATAVGSMSGRRELMAALEPGTGEAHDLSDRDDLWIDYIADTGDGWNATASIAWLTGRDALTLRTDGEDTPQPDQGDCRTETVPEETAGHMLLPGGDVLVLGGDQVYPAASPELYQRRFIDPFQSARYYARGGRALFAIPGNHDWYDGLTSFLRLFCQSEDSRRWFGAWQARQRRSYFALKLPHGWWLWGVDMALEDDLDPPQYDYFKARARELAPGDKVVLCVPAPTWLQVDLDAARRDPTLSRTADKLGIITDLARGGGDANVPIVLSGDLHYYAHHDLSKGADTRHYIVCGGGGAFGLGTTQTPKTFAVPGLGEATLENAYPDAAESARLRWGTLRFPFINFAFTALVAAVQLVMLWLLQVSQPPSSNGEGWIESLRATPVSGDALVGLSWHAAENAFTTPGLFLWLLLTLASFAAFGRSGAAKAGKPTVALGLGLLHGVLQTVGAIGVTWLAFRLTADAALPDSVQIWAALAIAAAGLYLFCGLLFGLYLVIGHRLVCLHDQEVYSAQGIEGFKAFLRIHVSQERLTLYPIGLRRPAQSWAAAPGVTTAETNGNALTGHSHIVDLPAGCQRIFDPAEPLAPHLIEPPIIITASEWKASYDL